MNIAISLLATITFIALLSMVILKGASPENNSHQLKYRYFAKRHIMTAREEDFFKLLVEIFDKKFYVFPQMHLSSLLNHKVRGQNWAAAFKSINGKSVDFVLCSKKTLEPACAIELDDSTHDSQERIARDEKVDALFEQAKIPLVRFRQIGSLTKQDIVDSIAEKLNSKARPTS